MLAGLLGACLKPHTPCCPGRLFAMYVGDLNEVWWGSDIQKGWDMEWAPDSLCCNPAQGC